MHQIFTFTTKIAPGRTDDLRQYLRAIEATIGTHPDLPFRKMLRLHFASCVIIDDPSRRFDPYLVFENNIDGTIYAYIEQLCDVAPTGLHTIFSMCREYGTQPFDRGRMRAYLRAHLLLPDASFVGNVGRTVRRIDVERTVVDSIELYVDELVARASPSDPALLYQAVRRNISTGQSWALAPQGRLSAGEMFKRRAGLAWIGALAYLTWPVTIPLLFVFVVVLRLHEMRDKSQIEPLAPERLLAASAREDQRLQNHFASVSIVKPGVFRGVTLRLVLFLVNRVAALSVNGTLSRLDNIHFAHWVLLDGGRRLLFLTNYDGSWENYLDDFIDKAAAGLTAIWSNVENFPATRFLVLGGARDERNFKMIARATQVETLVWYSAYPDLAAPSIDNNSAIRDGLATPPLRPRAVHDWLQRL